mgnify:CR=1 FL=1
MTSPFNVLFLCTGNSARSIMAEAYLNAAGGGRFVAYSAGSHPAGAVNPLALELLRKNRIDTAGLRSKNWDELARPGAAALDFVFQELRSGDESILPRLEREMIARAVDADTGDEIKIAKRLGLTKAALQKKLREA